MFLSHLGHRRMYKPQFDVREYRSAVPTDDTTDQHTVEPLDSVSLDPYVPEKKSELSDTLHMCVPYRLTTLTSTDTESRSVKPDPVKPAPLYKT